MKIDWNKDSDENAAIELSDGVETHYVSGDQLPDPYCLHDIAVAFSDGYDHNGDDETYAQCVIVDLTDGETHRFEFDRNDNFQWNSSNGRYAPPLGPEMTKS